MDNQNIDSSKDVEEDDNLIEKVPARYQHLYDSDDFEKFTYRKDWYE